MGASGSYPVVQPQFWNSFAQGAQGGQGIVTGGSNLAQLPLLIKSMQQQNQWNPQIWQSEIGLRGAQTKNLNKETQWYDAVTEAKINEQKANVDKIQYILKHPGYMAGDTGKDIQYLMDTGIIDPSTLNNRQSQQNTDQTQDTNQPSPSVSNQAGMPNYNQEAPQQTPSTMQQYLAQAIKAQQAMQGGQGGQQNPLLPSSNMQQQLLSQLQPNADQSIRAPSIQQQLMKQLNQQQAQPNQSQQMGQQTPQMAQAPQPQQMAAPQQMRTPESPQPSLNNDAVGFNTGSKIVDALLNNKFAQANYQQLAAKGYRWQHLTADAKNSVVAQGYGFGLDPMQTMDYVNKGYDMRQIAAKEGLDPDNMPPPIYPPTTATKTRVQLVNQLSAELSYVSSRTSAGIKQYSNTLGGYSFDRVKDEFSSDPAAQKRYGKYVASLSLQSGLALLRAQMEGNTKPGFEAMNDLKKSSLKGIDTHSPSKMTKVAYQAAQDYINDTLEGGAKIRTAVGMNPFRGSSEAISNNINGQNSSNVPSGFVEMWKKGNTYHIPAEDAKKAETKGYSYVR